MGAAAPHPTKSRNSETAPPVSPGPAGPPVTPAILGDKGPAAKFAEACATFDHKTASTTRGPPRTTSNGGTCKSSENQKDVDLARALQRLPKMLGEPNATDGQVDGSVPPGGSSAQRANTVASPAGVVQAQEAEQTATVTNGGQPLTFSVADAHDARLASSATPNETRKHALPASALAAGKPGAAQNQTSAAGRPPPPSQAAASAGIVAGAPSGIVAGAPSGDPAGASAAPPGTQRDHKMTKDSKGVGADITGGEPALAAAPPSKWTPLVQGLSRIWADYQKLVAQIALLNDCRVRDEMARVRTLLGDTSTTTLPRAVAPSQGAAVRTGDLVRVALEAAARLALVVDVPNDGRGPALVAETDPSLTSLSAPYFISVKYLTLDPREGLANPSHATAVAVAQVLSAKGRLTEHRSLLGSVSAAAAPALRPGHHLWMAESASQYPALGFRRRSVHAAQHCGDLTSVALDPLPSPICAGSAPSPSDLRWIRWNFPESESLMFVACLSELLPELRPSILATDEDWVRAFCAVHSRPTEFYPPLLLPPAKF
jgi:hypothetical protein